MRKLHRDLRKVRIIGILYRIIVMMIGFILLFLGVLMLALPGPGILTIIIALSMLATEFPWADEMLVRVKAKGEALLKEAQNKLKHKESRGVVDYPSPE